MGIVGETILRDYSSRINDDRLEHFWVIEFSEMGLSGYKLICWNCIGESRAYDLYIY